MGLLEDIPVAASRWLVSAEKSAGWIVLRANGGRVAAFKRIFSPPGEHLYFLSRTPSSKHERRWADVARIFAVVISPAHNNMCRCGVEHRDFSAQAAVPDSERSQPILTLRPEFQMSVNGISTHYTLYKK